MLAATRYISSSNILLQMERLQTQVLRETKHYQAYTNVGRHKVYK